MPEPEPQNPRRLWSGACTNEPSKDSVFIYMCVCTAGQRVRLKMIRNIYYINNTNSQTLCSTRLYSMCFSFIPRHYFLDHLPQQQQHHYCHLLRPLPSFLVEWAMDMKPLFLLGTLQRTFRSEQPHPNLTDKIEPHAGNTLLAWTSLRNRLGDHRMQQRDHPGTYHCLMHPAAIEPVSILAPRSTFGNIFFR